MEIEYYSLMMLHNGYCRVFQHRTPQFSKILHRQQGKFYFRTQNKHLWIKQKAYYFTEHENICFQNTKKALFSEHRTKAPSHNPYYPSYSYTVT